MFLGKDGFIWWIGVVEDIEDDLLLGRSKVRIFGYHPEYSSGRLDTSDLPWAYTIMPTNIPNAYGRPELGDWVFGFFLDADEAEEPAILGYLPGRPSGSGSFGRYQKQRKNFYNTSNADSFSITTRSGHKLDFQDGLDAESITLTHKNQNTFTMAANNDIIIKHQKGPVITLDDAGQTGQIKLTVANTLTSNTSSITMGSQFLELTGSQYLNIVRGTSSIQMFSNGNIQLTSSNEIVVNANSNLTFKDGSNTITLESLLYKVQDVYNRANTATSIALSSFAQANTAIGRLNNPTFGTSNGFTAIVGI